MKLSLAVLFSSAFTMLIAKSDFGRMVPVCTTAFIAQTQMGEVPCEVAVCRLESATGADSTLYLVSASERDYPPRVERIFQSAHSPIIEKRGDLVVVLFTAGTNTTIVAKFSIAKGGIEYLSEEAIAWNDRGVYRTSASFEQYSELLRRRDKKE